MNYEITSNWRGKCLLTKEEVGPIPINTLVFCFEEEKDYFRVYTREDYLGSRIEIDAYTHQFAEELLQQYGKEKALDILRGKVNLSSLNLSDEFSEYLSNVAGEKSTRRLKKKLYSHIMDLSKRKVYENILRATLLAGGELR